MTHTLEDGALLALLHVADSAFPTGAFACSQGMETLVDAGWVRDRESAERVARDGLAGGVGCIELPAVCAAHRAALRSDWSRIDDASAWLDAFAHARESRTASRKVGRRLLASVLTMCDAPEGVSGLLDGDGVHQATAFGVASALLGVPVGASAVAYAWMYCTSQMSAAARLVPLGQRDVLTALSLLRPVAAHAARAVTARRRVWLAAPTPLADIARMRHERQDRRLFVS